MDVYFLNVSSYYISHFKQTKNLPPLPVCQNWVNACFQFQALSIQNPLQIEETSLQSLNVGI